MMTKFKRTALLAAFALLLGACQPTPEERLADAMQYRDQGRYPSAIIELKNYLQARPDSAEARRVLADALFIVDDLGGAESQYRRLLSDGHGDARVWSAYGRTMLLQGRVADALERAGPDLETFSDDAGATATLGDIYRASGNIEEAEHQYRQALDLDPELPRAMVGVAIAAAQRGETEAADALSAAAVAAHPDDPYVLRTRGDVLSAVSDFAGAAESYDRAIDAEIASTPYAERYMARRSRIAALIEAQRLDDAERFLGELEAQLPEYPLNRYFRARIAFARGDYQLAENEMLEYLSLVPNDPRGQAVLGAINFSQNKLLQAEQYLTSAVRYDVGGDRVRILLAETQLRLDRPADAADLLEADLEDDDPDAAMLVMLGRARLGQGDASGAIEVFERAVADGEIDARADLALAATYLRSGRSADAEQLLESMQPAAGYGRDVLLLSAYFAQDKIDEARGLAQTLIRNNRDDPLAHVLVGETYQIIGDTERSRRHLQRALELDPGNAAALYSLAITAHNDGDSRRAESLLGQLLDGQPTNVFAIAQLAAMLERNDNLALIEPRLAAALEAAPESAPVRKLSARLRLALGDVEAALADAAIGRERFPEDPDFAHIQGLAALQSGDPAAAVTHLDRAAEGATENRASVVLDLARARLMNRDFAQAVLAAREYRELRPDDIRGLAVEVDAQLRSGDPSLARTAVDEFAAVHPDVDLLHLLRGDVELASNRPRDALQHYERYAETHWDRIVAMRLARAHTLAGTGDAASSVKRWLDASPDDAQARRIYGQLLENSGRVDEAILEYERLEKTGQIDAIGLNNLAWQYAQLGRQEAAALAERAHTMSPETGNITDTLGWILYLQGDLDRALEKLRLAAEQNPSNPEIQYHLAVALHDSGEGAEAKVIVGRILAADRPFPSRGKAEVLMRSL